MTSSQRPEVLSENFSSNKAWGTPSLSRGYSPFSGTRGRLFRGLYGQVTGSAATATATGPCFACGEFSRFRRNCPHVDRYASTAGNQSAATTARKQ
ncbi:hypothetical protein DPMN_110561 [Dreissena polymorpha]|uniref:CCHC-type domain-containing protein n=1 Tax=Dreissena polymorpha TaxID=45954 RepID=A0A9D4QN11_DREPO|nr:hypothetical protein DPMN_110561 [Dreissena polymorpha]